MLFSLLVLPWRWLSIDKFAKSHKTLGFIGSEITLTSFECCESECHQINSCGHILVDKLDDLPLQSLLLVKFGLLRKVTRTSINLYVYKGRGLKKVKKKEIIFRATFVSYFLHTYPALLNLQTNSLNGFHISSKGRIFSVSEKKKSL